MHTIYGTYQAPWSNRGKYVHAEILEKLHIYQDLSIDCSNVSVADT